MSFNLVPIMLLTYLPHVRALPLTYSKMINLIGFDPNFEKECFVLKKNLNKAMFCLFLLGCLFLFAFVLSVDQAGLS